MPPILRGYSAQTFDEKTYADINKRFEKDSIGF